MRRFLLGVLLILFSLQIIGHTNDAYSQKTIRDKNYINKGFSFDTFKTRKEITQYLNLHFSNNSKLTLLKNALEDAGADCFIEYQNIANCIPLNNKIKDIKESETINNFIDNSSCNNIMSCTYKKSDEKIILRNIRNIKIFAKFNNNEEIISPIKVQQFIE